MGTPNVGGYIRGPWWRYPGRDDETKTRRLFSVVWGAIAKEPSEKYKDLRIVRFVVKTGRGAGRNEKHLVCVGYGERLTAVIMRALEKHDFVFCAGTWVETITKTKKGEKPLYELRVNFIVALELIGFLRDLYEISTRMVIGLPRFLYGLYMDENLRRIAEQNIKKDEAPDPFLYDED